MAYLVFDESWNTFKAQFSHGNGNKSFNKLMYFKKFFNPEKIKRELYEGIKQLPARTFNSEKEMDKWLGTEEKETITHRSGGEFDHGHGYKSNYGQDYTETITTTYDEKFRSGGAAESGFNGITNCTTNYPMKMGKYYLLNFTFDDTRIKSAQVLCIHKGDNFWRAIPGFKNIAISAYKK
jgi:hypothetical protein